MMKWRVLEKNGKYKAQIRRFLGWVDTGYKKAGKGSFRVEFFDNEQDAEHFAKSILAEEKTKWHVVIEGD